MLRRCMLLAGLICVVWCCATAAQADQKLTDRKAEPAVDLYGDTLPSGALARLGTVRFRRGSDHYLLGIAFLADNKTLLTADGERVQFWDAKTGRLLREVHAKPLSIWSFAISPDAKLFAVAGMESAERAEIRIFETASGKPVQILKRAHFRDVDPARLAFSPDGKLLFSLGGNGVLRVEDVASGKERLQRPFPKDHAAGLVVSADGEYLAIASGANTRKLFLWKWQKEEPRLLSDPEDVQGISFSPDGRFLALASRLSTRLRMLEVPSGRLAYQRVIRANEDSDIWAPLFTPDGQRLLVPVQRHASGAWTTAVLDAKTGEKRGSLPGGAKMAVSPDSRFLASGLGQAVRIVDLKTRQDMSPTEAAHTTAPSRIRVSPHGVVVTAGGARNYVSDNTVRVWDGVSGKQRRAIRLDGQVRDIAVSGDGRFLAASCFDDSVRLFVLNDGREIYRLAGHGKIGGGLGATLAFAPDSRSFISWGDDLYLRQWDVKTGRALLEHRLRADGMPDPDARRRETASSTGPWPCLTPKLCWSMWMVSITSSTSRAAKSCARSLTRAASAL